MKPTNMPTGAQRNIDVFPCYQEVLTNNTGTFSLQIQGSFRVRATGATTVTVGGILAMTMSAGEIAGFNVGTGPVDNKSMVEVIIGGAPAYVQVFQEIERGRINR